jgi:hypothetical protein
MSAIIELTYGGRTGGSGRTVTAGGGRYSFI